ncbi:SDR family NAD(P)-dependent oxidoreductase [Shewanella sp. 0m-8]
MNVEGKTIVVTGATSGIGKNTALHLASLGANVVLLGRSHSKLMDTLSLLQGRTHLSFILDFSLENISLRLKEIFCEIGAVDGFFHCAGSHFALPIKATEADAVAELYKVNVFSAMEVAKELRKKKNHNSGCSLVLMSSASAIVGQPALSAYASSKGAILSLTRTLAAELSKDNIRVNSISAGIVKTEMTDKLFSTLDSNTVQMIEKSHLLGFGEVSDVSEAATFLLSESSKWITGSNLVVDGGFSTVK